MQRYVNYKTVIQRAELVAIPPELVAEFLKQRAAQSSRDWYSDVVDDEAETALAARGDPIIDLALARFGRHMEALRPMFQAAPAGSAIRCAILSNTVAGGMLFDYMPLSLFHKPEDAAAWLMEAPEEELAALFENSALGDSFLADLLQNREPWEAIDEQRMALIVIDLCRNERMRTPYDNEQSMDGYREYSHGSVFNAAWLLAGKVQRTKRWAIALGALYDRLIPDAFGVPNPLEIAAAWIADPSDQEMAEEERKALEMGYLGPYQQVRRGLARLALRKDYKLFPALLGSGDVALRAAAYADGDLDKPQLMAAYEMDGPLLYNEAIHNEKIWRKPEGRNALSTIAWAVVKADKHSDMMAANIYNDFNRAHRKKHPEWFGDDPTGGVIEASNEPATKADLQALAEAIGAGNTNSMQAMQNIFDAVKAMAKQVEWIWWFALVAMLISVWRLWK